MDWEASLESLKGRQVFVEAVSSLGFERNPGRRRMWEDRWKTKETEDGRKGRWREMEKGKTMGREEGRGGR